MKPSPEEVYGRMRDHYILFCEIWVSMMTEEEKDQYLGEMPVHLKGIDITDSFNYIKNLPEIPARNDLLELACQVKSGILAYSVQDHDLNEGLAMGVYADYIIEKLRKKINQENDTH